MYLNLPNSKLLKGKLLFGKLDCVKAETVAMPGYVALTMPYGGSFQLNYSFLSNIQSYFLILLHHYFSDPFLQFMVKWYKQSPDSN